MTCGRLAFEGILFSMQITLCSAGRTLKIMTSSTQSSNAFETVCERASQKNWCWNIYCTTCGHSDFRKAFHGLSEEGSPEDRNAFPLGGTSVERQSRLSAELAESSLSRIHAKCKFPDWLGYLGLGLHHTEEFEWQSRLLTKSWIPQFIEMLLPETTEARQLAHVLESEKNVLSLGHLEILERNGCWLTEPLRQR